MELTLDLTYLNEISGGDQEFINDILSTFLEEMPIDMKDLQTAIENKDISTIGKLAHKTKSTLHTVGLHEMKGLALKIEQGCKNGTADTEIVSWAKEFAEHMKGVYPNVESMLV